MAIGEKIQQLRKQRGLYQKELSLYLNVSVSTISNYEKGMYQPDLDTLCKLADYFRVSTDYLLGRTAEPCMQSDLDTVLASNYTAGDLLETALSLTPTGTTSLINYAEYLRTSQVIGDN